MPRRGPFYVAVARHLVYLGSSLFPPAAIVHGGVNSCCNSNYFLQQVVSELRFGSSALATIDDTRFERTVEFLNLAKEGSFILFSQNFFKSFTFPSHLITLLCLQNMSVPKIETDKFDGKSVFVMWGKKMKAVLVQNKIVPAICSPEEYSESSNEGHMKNKCFKRIKDEKRRKHGKGSNKTHDFDSDERAKSKREIERYIEREGVAPVTVFWLRSRSEGSDHLVTNQRRHDAASSTQPLLSVLSLSARHCSHRQPMSAVVPWSFIFPS
ncbi:hypothetical protein M9H77_11506 [Catharanthus roseus]|uniref:Uncharacterized protein n=1 Tax=Catharanthus roseus TaxID=4058 RepID=A0ACC0BEX5_CATRO|nr:hypothetical protein M9H77_11506 [Catharanthus roseus]